MTKRTRGRPHLTVKQVIENRRAGDVQQWIYGALTAGPARGEIARLQRKATAERGMSSSEFYRHLATCKQRFSQIGTTTRAAGISTDAIRAELVSAEADRRLVAQRVTTAELELWAKRPWRAVVRLARRRAARTP